MTLWPLPLSVQIVWHDGAALPLAFVRKLGEPPGTVSNNDGGGDDDDNPTPPPFAPKQPVAAADWFFLADAGRDQAGCLPVYGTTEVVAGCGSWLVTPARDVGFEQLSKQWLMRNIAACSSSKIGLSESLVGCGSSRVVAVRKVSGCGVDNVLRSVLYTACLQAWFDPSDFLSYATIQTVTASDGMASCLSAMHSAAAFLAVCGRNQTVPARRVPGEFYPLPIEPIPPLNTRICNLIPPSDRLPLAFRRKKVAGHAAMIPLAFECGALRAIPTLGAYIMDNRVSAEFDGLPLELLSASVKTDVASFCWQGSVTLPPEDFMRLNMDGRARGDEAQIKLVIDGEEFVFIAEDYSDGRQFAQKSYTVSGRSLTAKLTGDYAPSATGTVSADMYARQIADEQLALMPFSITFWQLGDWLVPGGVYSIQDKPPMAVLQDIAAAAGGYIESHPARPQISAKPKWPHAAWDVSDATPDVVVPETVIASISGQKRTGQRYDSVYLWADHATGMAGDVYRQNSARTERASAMIHPLYTDYEPMRRAGIAALSDSGVHKVETVKLPLSEAYQLSRAKLGAVWRINESSGFWQGVVTGVSVDVSVDTDGALNVWQTVVIDRYLDV